MAKPKKVTTEEMMRLIDEYHFEHPGTVIKIPAFGEYIRGKGYPVQDYTIRRDKELVQYKDSINAQTTESRQGDLVTYHTLDVDAFLTNNIGRDKIRTALIERDRYYASIAEHAVVAIKEKKEMEAKMAEQNKQIAEMKAKLESVEAKWDGEKQKNKDNIIATLKHILDDYIYPDAANAMLEKEGILDVVGEIVPRSAMERLTVHPDTDLVMAVTAEETFEVEKFQSVSGLRAMFRNEKK